MQHSELIPICKLNESYIDIYGRFITDNVNVFLFPDECKYHTSIIVHSIKFQISDIRTCITIKQQLDNSEIDIYVYPYFYYKTGSTNILTLNGPIRLYPSICQFTSYIDNCVINDANDNIDTTIRCEILWTSDDQNITVISPYIIDTDINRLYLGKNVKQVHISSNLPLSKDKFYLDDQYGPLAMDNLSFLFKSPYYCIVDYNHEHEHELLFYKDDETQTVIMMANNY